MRVYDIFSLVGLCTGALPNVLPASVCFNFQNLLAISGSSIWSFGRHLQRVAWNRKPVMEPPGLAVVFCNPQSGQNSTLESFSNLSGSLGGGWYVGSLSRLVILWQLQ